MTETADVVVVGGGVNGVSIAYALAARGVRRVVLCEKAALASGASGFSSALVRMHYTNEWDARLAFASFPVFRNWTEIMGGPSVFTHTGFVNVVAPEYADALRRNVEMLRAIGIDTVALSPNELHDLQPFANVEDLGAAAFEPASGYADPAATVEGFRRRAQELGVQVRQWTGVTRIRRQESRVLGVDTQRRGGNRPREKSDRRVPRVNPRVVKPDRHLRHVACASSPIPRRPDDIPYTQAAVEADLLLCLVYGAERQQADIEVGVGSHFALKHFQNWFRNGLEIGV
jgi:glycerol-3-phosphate dehydrogenase